MPIITPSINIFDNVYSTLLLFFLSFPPFFSYILFSLSFLVSASRQEGAGSSLHEAQRTQWRAKGGREESPFASLVEDVAQLIRVGWNLIKLT